LIKIQRTKQQHMHSISKKYNHVTSYVGERKVAEERAKLSILQFSKNSQIAAN